MGQVAMATDHGGWRTARTRHAGCPIGRRPSGPLEEGTRRARVGCSLLWTAQEVGDASGSSSKGARIPRLTIAQGTILQYCKLQVCAANEPGSFADSSLGKGTVVT